MSKRIADYGCRVGSMERGRLNKITDVPGVRVGHATIEDDMHHTGVTVIMPCEDNMFKKKLTAASFVLNGFGKSQGLVQVDELGTLETPIALTNTLNVVVDLVECAFSGLGDRNTIVGVTLSLGQTGDLGAHAVGDGLTGGVVFGTGRRPKHKELD